MAVQFRVRRLSRPEHDKWAPYRSPPSDHEQSTYRYKRMDRGRRHVVKMHRRDPENVIDAQC